MRKIVIHRPGGYDRLKLEEHRDPRPAAGEAAVEVEAIGVNYADVAVRMGLYSSARRYVGWPITPGFELAGRIVEVGSGSSRFEVGQEVFGVTRFGAYASRVVVPEHQLFARSAELTPEQAAAFPTVFLTAHYALFQLTRPAPGYSVLIHSAAGGVGGALTQLAHAAGCRVVGVVGASHKLGHVRQLGADHVLVKRRGGLRWGDVERIQPAGFDAVFDANGPTTLRESYRHLRPTGRLVVYGFHSMLPRQGGKPRWGKLALDWLRTPRFNPLEMTQENRSVLAFNLSYLFDKSEVLQALMGDLLRRLGEGEIRAPSTTTYPMSQVARAHEALESGQTVGKLVLIP
jgi:NADPH:quinone reductase-like Zn-dependent oxidoreductase